MKRRRHIRAKHRRLANHEGDLHIAFFRRMKKLTMAQRKKALVATIKSLGWKFVKIPRNFSRDFWLRNIALNKRIVLGTGWSKKTLREQCNTLCHELVHVWLRIRWGRAKFLARYLIAEWRWAIETSAYRITLYFIPEVPEGRARSMYKFYKLGRLKKRDTIEETVAVLSTVREVMA